MSSAIGNWRATRDRGRRRSGEAGRAVVWRVVVVVVVVLRLASSGEGPRRRKLCGCVAGGAECGRASVSARDGLRFHCKRRAECRRRVCGWLHCNKVSSPGAITWLSSGAAPSAPQNAAPQQCSATALAPTSLFGHSRRDVAWPTVSTAHRTAAAMDPHQRLYHEAFMREALGMVRAAESASDQALTCVIRHQAEQALASDETPVGCVFVRDGRVLGRGMNATNRTLNVAPPFPSTLWATPCLHSQAPPRNT